MSQLNVIVTGGFGALGRAVARTFAAQGHKVCRLDFAPAAPDANPSGIDLPGVDLTDGAACERAIKKVSEAFGGVDVLVNVAGGFVWETMADGSIDSWQRMYAMNVLTAATMTRATLPLLTKSKAGRVVNIGAAGAVQAVAGMGAYAASKAGVHRLTEALAAELAGSSVTVNAILPGIIDTPANHAAMPGADTSSWVKPEAIADVIAFLASSAARSISGALIPVTRGA